MARKRRRHGLFKAVLAVAAVAAVAGGAVKLWHRFEGEDDAGKAQARTATVLDEAEKLLKAHKAAEAVKLLDTADIESRSGGPLTLMLLARAEKEAGMPEKALAHLERAMRDYPSSAEQPRAAVAYARALEEAGKGDEAAKIYEKVRASAPPDMRAAATAGLGRRAEAKADWASARDLYREAGVDAKWDTPEWSESISALGRANVALIFSPEPTAESQFYAVQKGDSLTSIGNKLNTTQGLLTRANGVNDYSQLDIGQRLKYTPKDFRIIIERSKCRLFLRDKDGIFKMYPIGLGMKGHETSLGSFTLGNKQKDPIWHKPGEGPIPAGDPRNELGTRWMPLVPIKEGLPTDLGIHGTIAPESIGKFSSHGCARLLPADVEELYDLVVRGTPVEIVETYRPEEKG